MAKKTRTELSTLALNTNLPDNTTEQITPTTERSQLTDERESVVNYKDDLGGAGNAGKFLTVATDGESLTMVDEPSGVPDWVTFLSRSMRLFTSSVSASATIEWTYLDALDVLTTGGTIGFSLTGKNFEIKNKFEGETIKMSGGDISFMLEAEQLFRIRLLELTHYGDDFNMIAQDVFGASPLYNLNFKGRINTSSNRYTFSSISGGKENATEDDKLGFLSFKTAIADGTLTERLRISSGGNVGINNTIPSSFFGNASQLVIGDGSTSRGMTIYSSSADGQIFFADGTTGADQYRGIVRYEHSSDALVFFTNATEKMRISEYGAFDFNSRMTLSSLGNLILTTNNNATWCQENYNDVTGTSVPYGIYLQYKNLSPNNTGSQFLKFVDSSSLRFEVRSNGGVANYSGNNVNLSDESVKKNITDTPTSLNIIKNLEVKDFQYIDQTDDKTHTGVIAQQVLKTDPSLVDQSGELKMVYNTDLMFKMLKAIQEQQTIIEDLKARIEKLEL